MLLKDKVAVVTGSSRGIGRSIALSLARHGANIVTNAVNQIGAAQQVAKEIQATGSRAIAVQADISHVADVERLLNTTLEEFGRLDVLVNNAAAFNEFTLAYDMSDDDFERVVDVNLKGAFICARAAARRMREHKSGVILNISSAASRIPMTGDSAYAASKGGLEALTRALAVDLAPEGIRVLGVAPGHFDTADNLEWLQSNAAVKEKVLGLIPLARIGKKEELAELVAFLVSGACGYLIGQTIVVDGGLSIWGGRFQ